MEDDLNFFQMEDDIKKISNGRWPQIFQLEDDLKVFQMEDDLKIFQLEDNSMFFKSLHLKQPSKLIFGIQPCWSHQTIIVEC